MEPILLSDRIFGSQLREKHPKVYDAIISSSFGKLHENIKNHDSVHFCGMILLEDSKVAMFLPRGCKHTLQNAQLTMQALSRFGHDALEHHFEKDAEIGNSGLLSVIKRLAEDFIRFGIYSDRERVFSHNIGKANWARTLKSIIPIEIGNSRSIIYPNFITSRHQDCHSGLISKIQAYVINEILLYHGWWLHGLETRRGLLRGHTKPYLKRALWVELLRKSQASIYSSRALLLVRDLIYYLEHNSPKEPGNIFFGVEDFHYIWESMLRQTLKNTSSGWNNLLPKPVYIKNNGLNYEARRRGMQTDIILDNEKDLHLVDAKYYSATTAANAPGWPDISKQMFYEVALRAVVGSNRPIRNSFVFPRENIRSESEFIQPFNKIQMQLPCGKAIKTFPEIECHYLDPKIVMDSYVNHRQDILL